MSLELRRKKSWNITSSFRYVFHLVIFGRVTTFSSCSVSPLCSIFPFHLHRVLPNLAIYSANLGTLRPLREIQTFRTGLTVEFRLHRIAPFLSFPLCLFPR